MAVISNVRVNGQAASATTPVVAGLNPVFTWDFEEDPAASTQVDIELRIGTSSTNWGDTLFVGNVMNEIVASSANSYEFTLHTLSRGTTYYCQLRGTDPDGIMTTWEIFSFAINQLPFVTNCSLTPANPSSGEDVEINYDFHDADSHSQSGTLIRWFKNNLPVTTHDNQCILPASATSPGESWTAKIVPSDGLEFGAAVETGSVTISEVDASFQSVVISPLDGNVDDIYKVEYTIQDTEYFTAIGTAVIEWYVNGTLVEDSNQTYIRPKLSPGDTIYAIVKLVDGDAVIALTRSQEITVADVPWYVYNLEVSGLREAENLADLEPILEWNVHKTTATNPDQRPTYLNVRITTTPSLQGPVYDSGFIEYVKDSYAVPSGVLQRGRRYFIHVGAGDSTTIDSESYVVAEVRMSGSAWENEVNNATGWTIDLRMQLETSGEDPDTANMGMYVHDGTYYCSLIFGVRHVTLLSDQSVTYTFANEIPSLLSPKTFRVAAKGQDIKVFMNNLLIIDGEGFLTNQSNLRFIEFGDIDTRRTNSGTFRFFRYSVNGPYGFGLNLSDENTFYFDRIGFLESGSVDYAFENLLAWKPDSLTESSKLIEFNNNAQEVRLPTANRNYSPITKIAVDRSGNKFLGTANGITAIYGEKHDPDYTFDTSASNVQVLPNDFDRISTVDRSKWPNVEPDNLDGWLTIDSTYRAVGEIAPDDIYNISLNNGPSDAWGLDSIAEWETNTTEIQIGSFDGSSNHRNGYLRFPIDIEPGSVVSSSYITVQASDNRSPSTTSSIQFHLLDVDDMPELDTFSSEPGYSSVSSVSWLDPETTGLTLDELYNTIDISSLIQAFIDRPGYTPGNYMGLKLQSNGSVWDYYKFYSYKAGRYIPTLHVEVSNPDPYLLRSHAIHYFTQRVHGHPWYDRADNETGWRISFSFDLDFLEADNYEPHLDKTGFGVYVNDGTRQEIIYFYEDRIRLFYANVFVQISTVSQRDYAIVGKGDNIFVYQRKTGSNLPYSLSVNGSGQFITPATNTGNSGKPKMALDSQGLYHAVWHDDSNHRSQIFYSIHDGSCWSLPESVTESTEFNMRNADVDVDSSGRVWAVYEDNSWGPTEIVCSVRDSVGWNPKIRITNAKSNKAKPTIIIDSNDNAHVAWEDNRNGHWEIFWAQWDDNSKAWLSSAQQGSDDVVMTYLPEDPYQTAYVDFRNPKMDVMEGILWLVAEAHFEDNTSAIFRGYRDLEGEAWKSSGSKIKDADGNVIGIGTGLIVSPVDKNCVNPGLAGNINRNSLVIVWEDRTNTISQIWGASVNRVGSTAVDATQITDQLTSCSNPTVGWAANMALIVHERDDHLYLCYFDGLLREFEGSATGNTDRLLDVASDKIVGMPALAKLSPSRTINCIYEYRTDRDPYTASTIENADFRLIGDASVDHTETISYPPGGGTTVDTTTTTLADGSVSDLDTREFAFGDFSENVGLRAHWKDIEMYFGYDARPHNIINYSTRTVEKWPNDRITDLFVDYWGNLVAATFGGLAYMNVGSGEVLNIEGHTSSYSGSCTPSTCLLAGKLTTAVAWGKNGVWYVGTTSGLYSSKTAGRIWEELFSSELGGKTIYEIAVDRQGRAVLAASDGVYVAHPDMATPIIITIDAPKVKTVAVDENDIIWAGTDIGLFRISDFSGANTLQFSRSQGMRSSHVNDIAIVNKNLRYIATATGVERMHGSRFTNFNVRTHSLLNDNIASIYWDANTKSLWIGALYRLHQVVFRDTEHDIIDEEIVAYDSTEISTEQVYDTNIYTVLDFLEIQSDPNNPILLTTESAEVFINRNPVDFGFVIGQAGDSIFFLTDLLVNDQVEIKTSDKFVEFHDFNQTAIERSVRGPQVTSIEKLDRTSRDQLLLLSGTDKPGVLLYAGSTALPFTTIMLDRDLPVGCIEKLDTITRNIIRFRLLAFDQLSGLDSMIISNYENFTTDGETPQDYIPFQSVIDHDIGSGLTNVIDSLTFPSSVTIDSVAYNVGSGSAITTWFDEKNNLEYIYAATSSPAVIYRYDATIESWTALQALNSTDPDITVNDMVTINNVIWVTTGSSTGDGGVWKSNDGLSFDALGSVTGQHARGIAGSFDGTVYFGSSDGKIYNYKDNQFGSKREHQNIGQSVYDLDTFGTTLVVATGNQGRIYAIDLTTDSSIIIFSGTETSLSSLHVKDASSVTSPDDAILFAGSGESTTIYKSSFADFAFIKSFSSFGNNVNRISQVESIVLEDPDDQQGVSGTTVIAAVGKNLFKYVSPGWEFFYQHDEDILDVVQFFSGGTEGIWLVSANKVTKWTAVKSTKTVYLRLKDKAGNLSRPPATGGDAVCPEGDVEICCDYAYSLNIADLQNFVNEGRIVDISEYGEILFTYDSPNTSNFYSADQIDEEVGIYTSETFNGSNDIVSWKTISWESNEPTGTDVNLQIRAGVSEDDVTSAEWSANLVKNSIGNVSLEHVTEQYIQFRAILTSQIRDVTPTLTSVTLTNITAQASHFFTTNFVMPSRPIKGLLTANTFVPISADVIFGVSTKNSTDFGDYQIIEPNRLFTTSQDQFGENLRIGAKLLSPGLPQLSPSNNPGDPYDESSFICNVDFDFENIDSVTHDYHFRVRFYNDPFRTQLVYTFFTGNDQTGWSVDGGLANSFPATGVTINPSASKAVVFIPGTLVESDQKWYLIVDAFNGSTYETVTDNRSYICSDCNITNEPGVVGEYYGVGVSMSKLPDFGTLTPDFIYVEDDINFDFPSGTSWVTTSGVDLGNSFVNKFAARWKGRLQISVAGTYEFALCSDDGSKFLVDFVEVIDRDGYQNCGTETRGSVTLTEGYHEIEVQYFKSLGPSTIRLSWRPPGESTDSIVPASRIFHAAASEYCYDTSLPRIMNFGILFELENGETVKVNLSQ